MFEFKGEWEMELQLENFQIFKILDYNQGDSQASYKLFKFEIFDEFNYNPDPEEYQINAINYLLELENQTAIIKNLFEYSKNIIYPHYKTFMDDDDFPELNSINDIGKLYRIDKIIVKRIGHLNYAYYIFDCSSCLDHEHGIRITLFKDTIIDHGEDWDDRKVCEHKGIDYKSYQEKATKEYNHTELKLIKPHEKYGKLKPWQNGQNEHYPFGLFHAKKDKELIEGFKNGSISIESYTSRLLTKSISQEREDLTQFLIDLNPKFKYLAFKEALLKNRFDLTDKLIKQGYNLNDKNAFSSHFTDTITLIVRTTPENEQIENYRNRLKYLMNKGLNPYLVDKYNRNSLSHIKRIEDENLRHTIENDITQIMATKSYE